MRFHHVGQASLELLTSGDPSASASQNAWIAGMSHCAQLWLFSNPKLQFRIVLAIWALFWFHIKFIVFFSHSVKKVNGSLMQIALNL